MSRGGKRNGAGRKDQGLIQFSCKINQEDAEFIKATAYSKSTSQRLAIHSIIEFYKKFFKDYE